MPYCPAILETVGLLESSRITDPLKREGIGVLFPI
jgi:hypothetical protein